MTLRGQFNLRGFVMQGVARKFFILGIVMAIAGMMLGLKMAMTNNHVQMPVHAHIMVAGWLMSAVFGFFYHLFPVARQNKLATIHFWMHAVGIVVLTVSLYFVLAGNPGVEPVTAVASILFFLGMLLFAWIAIPVVSKA
jgi:predicted membrane channel-forming protein YqfA (hemolysin III family)